MFLTVILSLSKSKSFGFEENNKKYTEAHTQRINKYTIQIRPPLNTPSHRPHMGTLLGACHLQTRPLCPFQPTRCCSLWGLPRFCGFSHGNRMTYWVSMLLIKKYLDKFVQLGNIPLLIDDRSEFRLTIEAEGLSEDLKLSLAGLRGNDTVDFLVFCVHNKKVPLLYRPKNYHLINVGLYTSMVKFFAKMFSDLDRNIGEGHTKSQDVKSCG